MANINAESKTGIIPVRPGMLTGSSPGGKPAEGQAPNNNDTNTKEKTPMCLLNELAQHTKLKHQYTLIDEQGPAHKKTFFVQLVLGEEEYSSVEGSIKRAQHLAAQIALQTTKYKQPQPKEEKELGLYELFCTNTTQSQLLSRMAASAAAAESAWTVASLPAVCALSTFSKV